MIFEGLHTLGFGEVPDFHSCITTDCSQTSATTGESQRFFIGLINKQYLIYLHSFIYADKSLAQRIVFHMQTTVYFGHK